MYFYKYLSTFVHQSSNCKYVESEGCYKVKVYIFDSIDSTLKITSKIKKNFRIYCTFSVPEHKPCVYGTWDV